MLDHGTVVAPCRVRNGTTLGIIHCGFFFFFWRGYGGGGAKRYPRDLMGIEQDWNLAPLAKCPVDVGVYVLVCKAIPIVLNGKCKYSQIDIGHFN